MNIGLWDVGDGGPKRLQGTNLEYEKQLEDWIAADPSLLQSGLTIVGRQLPTEGGPVDLLAIDPQGRWIVIEIKRGFLEREVVAQVIDYASSLVKMPEEELREKTNSYLADQNLTIDALLNERLSEDAIQPENREILLMVVGAGKAPRLDRMAEYMTHQYEFPISVVTFQVFRNSGGSDILARELFEPDFSPRTSAESSRPSRTIDEIASRADEAGVGTEFRTILKAALEVGLYPRPYRRSIMYTPPWRRDRMIFTVWAERKDNGVSIYAGPGPFTEFYPLTERDVKQMLGFKESGWYSLDVAGAKAFAKGLVELLKNVHSEGDGGA